MGKGEATRAKILDEAIILASRLGLEGLTLGVLAESIGCSKSGLYAHFRSKEALVLAVIEHTKARHWEHARKYMDGKAPGIDQLRAYYKAWLDWTALPSLPAGCPLMGASFEFEDLEGHARDAIVELTHNTRAFLKNLLQQAIANRDLVTETPIDQVLFEMLGIVLAFHLGHRLMREAAARERAEKAFESLLARYQAPAGKQSLRLDMR